MTKMKVTLTRVTQNPVLAIEEAASNCYDSQPSADGKIMNACYKSGHHSVLEFADFTFHIEFISRACSHQVVRHRTASYAQRSQRYVEEDKFAYVTPPTIQVNKDALILYMEHISYIICYFTCAYNINFLDSFINNYYYYVLILLFEISYTLTLLFFST